jgi:hypothetical protein
MPALTSSKRVRPSKMKIKGAKPKTTDEINDEYDRLEQNLLESHRQQLLDLEQEYQWRLQDLREARMAELAEVEAKSNGTD